MESCSNSLGPHSRICLSEQTTINQDAMKDLNEAFHNADSGYKGYLTQEDVKVAMVILFGYKPSKDEINYIMSKAGCFETSSKPKGIDKQTFLKLMAPKLAVREEDDKIRQIFLAFDSQCRGFLTLDDLHRAFSVVAPHLPTLSIENAFREIDRDCDGHVSYRDFEFMMKYSLDDNL